MNAILTDIQVADIQSHIVKKMGASQLTDELLDHICILTEVEMQTGKPFKAAFETAFSQFDRTTLQDIRSQEQVFSWTKSGFVKGLLAVIIGLICLGLSLFFLKIKGFRLILITALFLANYILLPLFFFKKGWATADKIVVFLTFLLIFINLNGLMFLIAKLKWWRIVGAFMLVSTVGISFFRWFYKRQKM
jgi:hypothetical protein